MRVDEYTANKIKLLGRQYKAYMLLYKAGLSYYKTRAEKTRDLALRLFNNAIEDQTREFNLVA